MCCYIWIACLIWWVVYTECCVLGLLELYNLVLLSWLFGFGFLIVFVDIGFVDWFVWLVGCFELLFCCVVFCGCCLLGGYGGSWVCYLLIFAVDLIVGLLICWISLFRLFVWTLVGVFADLLTCSVWV